MAFGILQKEFDASMASSIWREHSVLPPFDQGDGNTKHLVKGVLGFTRS